jgi:hypothetical protein
MDDQHIHNEKPVQGQNIAQQQWITQHFQGLHKKNKMIIAVVLSIIMVLILIIGVFGLLPKFDSNTPPDKCYGGSHILTITVINTATQDIERTKTENCHDINLRFTALPHPVMVQVCFVTNSWCGIHDDPNGWVTFQQPSFWKAVVTDVRPTTKFFLKFKSADASSAPFPVIAEIAY